jgi:hypothetical protein
VQKAAHEEDAGKQAKPYRESDSASAVGHFVPRDASTPADASASVIITRTVLQLAVVKPH